MREQLSIALTEDILCVLCHSDEYGKIVANMVDAGLFEAEYRTIAERAIDYWRNNGSAPKVHLDTIMADVLEDAGNRRAPAIRRIMIGMLHAFDSINAKYVVTRLRTFTRLQALKSAILSAAEELNQPNDETTLDKVETLLQNILSARDVHFDAGIRLHDYSKMLEYLESHYNEFSTGIEQLDKNHIVPARGELMLLLGAAGAGKSWWLANLAKHAMMQRKKVLHITLEMPAEQMMQRYYQCLFSASKREAGVEITTLRYEKKRLVGIDGSELIKPEFTFDHPELIQELETRLRIFGERMSNVIIKRFPPRHLTANMLNGYLDSLETMEYFIPDLLLIDYPQIMKVDPKNIRISIGDNIIACRAVAVERNMAVAAVHQLSKAGSMAPKAGKHHVSEDWSVVQTADQILTFSATEAEQQFGLGRISVDKARNEKDKWTILITQNYDLGQFVLQSAFMPSKYFDLLKKRSGTDEDDEEEDNDNDDE